MERQRPTRENGALAEAREAYVPDPHRNETQTNFWRGSEAIDLLDRLVPAQIARPHILLVGAGLKAYPLQISYIPFKLAAHLEANDADYTMTIVDKEKDVLDDISQRTKLYVTYMRYPDEWKQYLRDTKQTGNIIHTHEAGLHFIPQDYSLAPPADYLERGVHAADVPRGFRERLEDGRVSLLHRDIAADETGFSQPFDFVDISNVLYLLPPAGQHIALDTISQNMTPGGLLLGNDIDGGTGNRVFSQNGGWLTPELTIELGFRVDKPFAVEDRSFVLEKAA